MWFIFITELFNHTGWAVWIGDHGWVHDLGWAPVDWAWWGASLGWEPGQLPGKWEGWDVLRLLRAAGWCPPVARLAVWVCSTLVGTFLKGVGD